MRHVGGIAVTALVTLILAAYVPDAAAGPSNIANCRTLSSPGAYVVTRSITAVGTCITVAADFVTIDLDGQTLTGDRTGFGVSDGGVARTGIVVRNGTIENFGIGIQLGFSNNIHIDQIRVFGSVTTGIGVGRTSTLTRNTASNNGGHGIDGTSFSIVTGNTASFNGVSGIGVGPASTVTGNTASNNGFAGIGVGSASTVTGNTASFNGGPGIVVDPASTVTGNTASNNGGIGIDPRCPGNNLIGNTAQNNTGGNTSSLVGCSSSNNLF